MENESIFRLIITSCWE